MTAINVILQKKQAFVLTDTAAYSPQDGIPHSFHYKALAVQGCRLIVASRGDVNLTQGFAQSFPIVYDDLDHAIEDDFQRLKWIYDVHSAVSEDSERVALCDVVFVGWSERERRPIGRMLIRRDGWELRIIDPDEGIQMPALEGEDMLALADHPEMRDFSSMDTFDPKSHGLVLLEAQRRVKFQIAGMDLPPMFLVGGHIHLTTVTERGVVQETLRDWNDEVGVPLSPPPLQKPRTAASDALDRAAEKRARKAAKLAKVAA
ncbi:hypothetical protein [Aureimonas phyllosphaerae]|uniref:Uncharacterized protein n=1 Tax=Aureimonas phyllosphaerae TaxID=1166078 RepID=A0A7W6BSM7_9HYPH|nr:hypothetical protein [Aureimonas phyllosphaerae]MBB3934288.1 hypothetical protein [Aureimonas phyllosphaerae]MBB3958496.1 hypothetical protein [Aureimonas phyllosphaerae]SFE97965.1 hypothetical protein SAMN05216566_101472 [Aureimonas phyllosphaerae]